MGEEGGNILPWERVSSPFWSKSRSTTAQIVNRITAELATGLAFYDAGGDGACSSTVSCKRRRYNCVTTRDSDGPRRHDWPRPTYDKRIRASATNGRNELAGTSWLVFVGALVPRTGVANGHRERCKNLEKRKIPRLVGRDQCRRNCRHCAAVCSFCVCRHDGGEGTRR